MQRAGSAVRSLLGEMGMESALRLHRIRAEWEDLFAGPFSSHAYPSSLSDGILVINVESSAWLQQLNFLKGDILRKLKGFEVKEIRLRLGGARTPLSTHK